MITASRLETLLEAMCQQYSEWEYDPHRGENFWVVTHQKSYPPFHFYIEFDEELLYVQYLFRDIRIRYACWPALYRVLLRLNEELSLIKFGVTNGSGLSMMGELPAEQFSLNVLQNLLRLMVQCLEDLYWEIAIVAESEALAPFLTTNETYLFKLDQESRALVQKIKTEQMVAREDKG